MEFILKKVKYSEISLGMPRFEFAAANGETKEELLCKANNCGTKHGCATKDFFHLKYSIPAQSSLCRLTQSALVGLQLNKRDQSE